MCPPTVLPAFETYAQNMVRPPQPMIMIHNESTSSRPFSLGDVVHLEIPGKAVVVLGSQEAASELLEKRSSNYSDRPCSPMVDMYVVPSSCPVPVHSLTHHHVNFSAGFGWSFAFREYGPFWRRGRRAFHQFFNQTAVQKYIPDQRLEAHRLVIRLIDNPEAFIHHIRQ